MNADGAIERRVSIGEADASFKIGRAVAGADGDHMLDARVERALDDFVAIGGELVIIEMAMGIDEHLFQASVIRHVSEIRTPSRSRLKSG
jgi:hypothetical protein